VAILGEAEDVAIAERLLEELLATVREGQTPTVDDVAYGFREVREANSPDIGSVVGTTPTVLRRDIAIKPRTSGQRAYLEAIRENELVLAIGPAGTGKTYLAMAAAVSALLNKEVNRIVLTRPAVEAGENLGFLPGDMSEKVNPYLRPLFDALYSMVDPERVKKWFERDQVEVAPLAFMRGRTLDHCFAILDEAQNTTTAQMKMFLTRFGQGSRAIITGDVTQVDLSEGTESGLTEASRVLARTKGVGTVSLESSDVVRHPLVQEIVEAYESDERARDRAPKTKRAILEMPPSTTRKSK
jgi:phosphate starvation-inducible PhoH-like protein